MNQDQVDSIVRKLLAMFASILGAHGMAAMATTVNSTDTAELVSSIVLAGLTFYASHKSNATQPVNTTVVTVTPAVTTETTTTPTFNTAGVPTKLN